MGSLHNEIHYGGRELQAFAIAVGLGDEEGVARLGESLTPTLDVRRYPEYAFLRGERLCAVTVQQAAVVGEVGMNAVVNPSTSDILVVVERAALDNSTAATAADMQIATQAAIEGTMLTVQKGQAVDTRWPARPENTVCDVRSGTDAVLQVGVSIERRRKAAAESFSFENLPVILTPGFGLLIAGVTANIVHRCNFYWRERTMLPRELRAP